jgi:pimeloyl-ACP methyl ester carboxylesterase
MTAPAQPSRERPVLLLHGCGGSFASAFEKTGWLDSMRRAGLVPVAVDLPGHGMIPAPRDPGHYADLAGLLLPSLPAGTFDAVGFSLGAKLLLELALRVPSRLGRLVLGGVGDNVFAPERVGGAAARALESGPDTSTPAAVLAFLSTWEPHRNDALAVAAVLRRPPNPVFTPERLAQLSQPVLVVNGSDDPVARDASRLLGSLGNVRHMALPGVGHFDLTAQLQFIAHAIEFLLEGRK